MADPQAEARLTPLELMTRHLDALYSYDEQGRMLGVNQWDGGLPPRVHLGRTKDGNIWRVRADLPTELAAQLDAICREEPAAPDLSQPPGCREDLLQLLADHESVARTGSGPAYVLPVAPPAQVQVTAITPANATLLEDGLDEWLPDVPHRQPFVADIVDGRAVALCASARITPVAHEAGVETVPAYRRRGHATAAVMGWAAAVQAQGAIALYSTSWENIGSQAVAARVGGMMYGADFSVS